MNDDRALAEDASLLLPPCATKYPVKKTTAPTLMAVEPVTMARSRGTVCAFGLSAPAA